MSEFISTKTPCQCRSHHQKFFYKTINKLNYKRDNQIGQSVLIRQNDFELTLDHQTIINDDLINDDLINDDLINYHFKYKHEKEDLEVETIFSMKSQQ